MSDILNKQQAQAAYYDGESKNILVIAGAGSGKTKTMISRIEFLINKKEVSPSRILCLTFTNKAAKEIVHRLSNVISNDMEDIVACTFHSFCIQLIKQIPKSFGFSTPPTIIDQSEQKTLISMCLQKAKDETEIDEEEIALIPKADKIMTQYSYARNANRSIKKQFFEYLTEHEEILNIALKTISFYEDEKKNYNYVDFDDILERVASVSEEKPDIAEAISNLYDEVLVDELQDTNPVQYRILKLLGAGNARVFAVGDPAQSIYGFRGADFKSIYNFTKIFERSEKINLFINYRSTQEILDVANSILNKSTYKYDNELISNKGYSGEKSELHDFYSNIEEASFIAKDILKHRENNGDFKDIFVITRSAYAAIGVESMLRKYNIPYDFIGGMSINKTAHIQDLMSLLKTVYNPKDKLSCIRFLSMFKGVGQKTANKAQEKIMHAKNNNEISEIISDTVKKDKERAKSIFDCVSIAIENNKNPIEALLKSCFTDVLKEKYQDNFEARLNNVKTVGQVYKQYNNDIGTFISDFTLEPSVSKIDDDSEDIDKITIITAHSAKGLENKVCYVIGASPGSFPSKRSIGSKSAEEEERRVMYVALTRAIDKLVVTRVLEYDNYLFRNAKTDIDFIESIKSKFSGAVKKKKNTGFGGLSSLKDNF